MTSNKIKTVLIGSGRFIEDTVLPAFKVLDNQYEIIEVINKSGELSEEISKRFGNIPTTNEIETLATLKFDCLFISIPQQAIKTVLTALNNLGIRNKQILFTTPVAPLKSILQLKKITKNNAVYAFEFLPFHPAYTIAKEIIKENKIGQISSISLYHCGYLYHGLATLRFLNSYHTVSSSQYINQNKKEGFSFKFSNQVTGEMVGPKDYENGCFVIKGSLGEITNKESKNSNSFKVTPIIENSYILSYAINNIIIQPSLAVQQVNYYLNESKFEKPIYKQEFLIAAVDYLQHFALDKQTELHKIEDTLFEHWLIRITRKLKSLSTQQPISMLKRLIKRIVN